MSLHVPVPSVRTAARTAVLAALSLGLVGAPVVPAAAQEPGRLAQSTTASAPVADRAQLAARASRGGARPRLAAAQVARPQEVAGPRVTRTERLPLPFRTLRREDASRYRGEEAVVQAGREGVLERTYADLGRAGSVLLQEERVREPQSRIVAVGTKQRPAYGGLDWAALAQCESGGDPRAVSSTGRYRGLYQFSLSTWRSVGGSGDPVDHSRDSQTAHAHRLYLRDGRAPWPHCGRHL